MEKSKIAGCYISGSGKQRLVGLFFRATAKNRLSCTFLCGKGYRCNGKTHLDVVDRTGNRKIWHSGLVQPVGTVEVISNAATAGTTAAERISSVLHLTIFITINVGIFNLLPIPGLDGSRFWFLFLEAIRRKPVKKNMKHLCIWLGWQRCFY